MDVESGKFEFDFRTGQVKSEVSRNGYLAPEIEGEGQKVLMSDGSFVNFNPPANKPITPDWSAIKSIAKYFNRTDFHIWPHWFYHPTKEAIVIRNAEEAAQLGIRRRESTMEERARMNCGPFIWEWPESCLWRPTPYAKEKFDFRNPGTGKTYVPEKVDPALTLNATMRQLTDAFKGGAGPNAPASVDPTLWAEFLAFQAWKQATEKAEARDPASPAIDPERLEWEEAARRVGVKPDGRWNLEKLKAKVQEAAAQTAPVEPAPEQAA